MPPRPIKPADNKSGDQSTASPISPKTPTVFKKREKITSVACNVCQRRKRKCNGARPTCAACAASGKADDCTYNYDGDQTRSTAIRNKNTALELEVQRLNALLDECRIVENDPKAWTKRLQNVENKIAKAKSDSSTAKKEFPRSKMESTADSSPEGVLAELELHPDQTVDTTALESHIDPQLMSSGMSLDEPKMPFQPGAVASLRQEDHRLAKAFGAYPVKYEILESRLTLPFRDDQRRNLRQNIHTLQPLNFEDFPPDDGISTVESMSSFISVFRGYAARLVEQNVPEEDILGPPELEVQALFRQDDFRQARTVSTFVPRFVSNFHLLGLKEKLAFCVVINLVLRWQLFPNRKTYHAMPDWLRPTPTQIFLPHFSSIEYLAWPDLRDVFIYAPHQYINIVSAAFKFHWDQSDADLFVYDSDSGLATGISSRFMTSALDLKNWTLDDQLLDLWPAIEGKANFVRSSAH